MMKKLERKLERKIVMAALLFCFCLGASLLGAEAKEEKGAEKTKQGWIKEKEKLVCYDKKGKVVKELSLTQEKRTEEREDTEDELDTKTYQFKQKKVNRKYDVELTQSCQISPNQKYVLLVSETRDAPAGYLGRGEGVTKYTGKIALYDQSGNLLFEKEIEKGTYIIERELSNNGMVIVVTEAERELEEYSFYLYDKTGKEILKYPNKENGRAYVIDSITISPNQRYLAFRVGIEFAKGGPKTIFFDLEKRKEWMAERSYLIEELNNVGKVKVFYKDPKIKVTHPDFPGHLFDKPVTEVINLKKHFGE